MQDVQFGLIGPMELRIAGAPVRLPGAAERGLLALLLLAAGRTVSASSLVDQLWSESQLPADPVNALQLRVSKLRRSLAANGCDAVIRDATGYRVDVPAEAVDAHRFVTRVRDARRATADAGGPTDAALQAYDEALALWRGEPLADFAGSAWATVEAARLTQLRLAVLTERAETALGLGRHAEVAADLEPVVAQDPKQEALAALLMTALYRAGRQADALDVFTRTRLALDDELGLQPSVALRSLHQRVLEQDPELAGPTPEPQTAVAQAPGAPAPAVAKAEASSGPAAGALPTAVRLIGRDSDIDAVAALLRDRRVVTLVGPGGAGKTSLALAVAHAVSDGLDGAVHVARLAPALTAADVSLAVADALGVPLDGADPNANVRDRLVAYLSARRLLLVLDNCEHVVDEAAALTAAIASAAPSVTVLATSREALAVPGEVQVSVAPLTSPPPGTPPGEVLAYPAAELFVERAKAVHSELQLSDPELQSLGRVCMALDGMPLALELAAARMSTMSVLELEDRLRDRFAVLTSGPRTAEARQRTLRATVEWSHALLGEDEQRLFRRLAVFQGGWTLAAAERVAADDGLSRSQVLDLLDHLVGRSMVTADRGLATRFRMLETLRQFAGEQLTTSGERDLVAARHAAYFREVAEDAEASLRGRGQREALTCLRAEHANLRAALTWLGQDPTRLDDALHLAGSLGLFWHLGRHVEGREILRDLVTLPGGSRAARARALQAVSVVERPRACLVHPSTRCAETARESLELFEAEGDAHRAALSRVLLAVEYLDGSAPDTFDSLLAEAEHAFTAESDDWGHAVVAFVRLQHYLRRGDEDRARATGRAAAEAFRVLDDPWGMSAVLYHLGWGLKEFGRHSDAVPVLEQAIEVATSAGLYNTVQWALADLASALLALGQTDAARECFDRAGAASQEVGDAAGEVLAVQGRAVLAQIAGDAACARELFQAAFDGFERLGTPLWTGTALAGLGWCDVAQQRLDDARATYERVLALGEALAEPALTAAALEGLARVEAATGDSQQAAALVSRAADVRLRGARPAPPHEQADLRARLGADVAVVLLDPASVSANS